MEKQKLKLGNVKVESFVTKLDDAEKVTVNGAAGSGWMVCSLFVSTCALSFNCPKTYTCNPAIESIMIQDCNQADEFSKDNPGFCLNSHDPGGCISAE